MGSRLQSLKAELDLWPDSGPRATFWMRDDDASEPNPALERLLALTEKGGVPLVVAVIPDPAQPSLVDAIAPYDRVIVAQHGIDHQNRGAEGEDWIDLGGGATDEEILDALAAGRDRLQSWFGRRWAPILVPPWNHIRDSLIPKLPEHGYAVLSRDWPRPPDPPVEDLTHRDTHIDLMDWPNGGGFVGADRVQEALVRHLSARREGSVDTAELTGILCHHWAHDEGCWAFLEDIVSFVNDHPAARWSAP